MPDKELDPVHFNQTFNFDRLNMSIVSGNTIIFDSYSLEREVHSRNSFINNVSKLSATERRYPVEFTAKIKACTVTAVLGPSTLKDYVVVDKHNDKGLDCIDRRTIRARASAQGDGHTESNGEHVITRTYGDFFSNGAMPVTVMRPGFTAQTYGAPTGMQFYAALPINGMHPYGAPPTNGMHPYGALPITNMLPPLRAHTYGAPPMLPALTTAQTHEALPITGKRPAPESTGAVDDAESNGAPKRPAPESIGAVDDAESSGARESAGAVDDAESNGDPESNGTVDDAESSGTLESNGAVDDAEFSGSPPITERTELESSSPPDNHSYRDAATIRRFRAMIDARLKARCLNQQHIPCKSLLVSAAESSGTLESNGAVDDAESSATTEQTELESSSPPDNHSYRNEERIRRLRAMIDARLKARCLARPVVLDQQHILCESPLVSAAEIPDESDKVEPVVESSSFSVLYMAVLNASNPLYSPPTSPREQYQSPAYPFHHTEITLDLPAPIFGEQLPTPRSTGTSDSINTALVHIRDMRQAPPDIDVVHGASMLNEFSNSTK